MNGISRLSVGKLTASFVVQLFILLILTYLFCFSSGIYLLYQVAGALFTLSFIYATLGLTIWTGRALRFGLFTGGFKLPVQATQNDILTLDPMRRGWRLVVIENQTLIAWTAVGILGMAAAQLYYSGVNGGYPPDTILRFLISPWINPQYIPLG